jgi:hypothetical protein
VEEERSEVRGQRSEDRGQRSEDRGQRTEDRGFTAKSQRSLRDAEEKKRYNFKF